MSKFYFDSSSASSDDDDNHSTLPFPAPLSRSAFSNLDEPFSPTAFLASLRNRHQTLEDLRTELRARSKDLEKELVELVNRDYADFVGLGGSLVGGDGKVVDVRMGLLGFRREVEGLVRLIEGVRRGVRGEVHAREAVREQKRLAKNLITLSQRLDELSSLLLINPPTAIFTDNDAEDGADVGVPSMPRLKRTVLGYLFVTRHLLPNVPADHPFVQEQTGRLEGVRKTLLLDLDSALREARTAGDAEKVLVVLGFYADMEAQGEGVRLLREGKGR